MASDDEERNELVQIDNKAATISAIRAAYAGDIKSVCEIFQIAPSIKLCSNIAASAAEKGHLKIIKWCHANDFVFTAEVAYQAARNGHLNVITWCCENKVPLDHRAADAAISHGHLAITIYLYVLCAPAPHEYMISEECRKFCELFLDSWNDLNDADVWY